MPDLDGNQFIALSRLVNPPPVVVLTGNIFSVRPNPLIKQIAYKPIPIDNLLALIDDILFPAEQEVPVPDQSAFITQN